MNTTVSIPNKSVFKLNEICGITGVKPYVIRFWESEFEEISPITSSSGQKLYEHKDIETISLVKKLLFEDKMSIEQAKLQLKNFECLAQDISTAENNVDSNDYPQTSVSGPMMEGAASLASVSQKGLNDQQLEKLAMAKSKIQNIIQLIEAL